jgi:hypothetical protein
VQSKLEQKIKAMTQDKIQHHVIFASAVLLLLFAGLTLFVVSIVRADPSPDAGGSMVEESTDVSDPFIWDCSRWA